MCMKDNIITQKQLKKVQNANTETNEEKKGNWDSKSPSILKYRAEVISVLLSVMFSNALFQKISTYPWAQILCTPFDAPT